MSIILIIIITIVVIRFIAGKNEEGKNLWKQQINKFLSDLFNTEVLGKHVDEQIRKDRCKSEEDIAMCFIEAVAINIVYNAFGRNFNKSIKRDVINVLSIIKDDTNLYFGLNVKFGLILKYLDYNTNIKITDSTINKVINNFRISSF